MYKYVILIILIVANISQIDAQISNNASGSAISSNYGSVTYSIGEICYVAKGSHYTLTEGVQNGITINPSNNKSSINVSIYPNPTSDLVYFKVQNLFFDNLSYKIYHIAGIELLNGKIHNVNTSVSLRYLPAAVYMCKIYRNQSEILTFQIIKI